MAVPPSQLAEAREPHEEAARICGTTLGTIKSCVSRARARLAELLDHTAEEDLGPDRLVRASLFLHASP